MLLPSICYFFIPFWGNFLSRPGKKITWPGSSQTTGESLKFGWSCKPFGAALYIYTKILCMIKHIANFKKKVSHQLFEFWINITDALPKVYTDTDTDIFKKIHTDTDIGKIPLIPEVIPIPIPIFIR